MTSLRGPDPYAAVEDALATLAGRDASAVAAVCDLLHETIPTYTWVALIRRERSAVRIDCQRGQPYRVGLPNTAALLCAAATNIADVAATPPWDAAFPAARALIAVPAGPDRALVVASAHRGAFGPTDRALLERSGRELSN